MNLLCDLFASISQCKIAVTWERVNYCGTGRGHQNAMCSMHPRVGCGRIMTTTTTTTRAAIIWMEHLDPNLSPTCSQERRKSRRRRSRNQRTINPHCCYLGRCCWWCLVVVVGCDPTTHIISTPFRMRVGQNIRFYSGFVVYSRQNREGVFFHMYSIQNLFCFHFYTYIFCRFLVIPKYL